MAEQSKNILDQFLYDAQFDIIKTFSQGIVRRHKLIDTAANDYNILEIIASEKALTGLQVDIMPTLGNADDPLRNIIFYDSIYAKSPDLRVNGVLTEVENPTNPTKQNNLSHSIGEGASQAHHVIINLPVPLDHYYIWRVSKGRFKLHDDLKRIEFRYKGEYKIFER